MKKEKERIQIAVEKDLKMEAEDILPQRVIPLFL